MIACMSSESEEFSAVSVGGSVDKPSDLDATPSLNRVEADEIEGHALEHK